MSTRTKAERITIEVLASPAYFERFRSLFRQDGGEPTKGDYSNLRRLLKESVQRIFGEAGLSATVRFVATGTENCRWELRCEGKTVAHGYETGDGSDPAREAAIHLDRDALGTHGKDMLYLAARCVQQLVQDAMGLMDANACTCARNHNSAGQKD